MRQLPKLAKAKEELTFLQEFIVLTESYEETTLQQQIIKRYAITGSMVQVVVQLNAERQQEGLLPIESSYVSEVIRSKPNDPLHKMVRSQYMKKTRHARNKPSYSDTGYY